MNSNINILAVSLLFVWMIAIPKEASAECASEDRIAMARQGMSRSEINRRCGQGPVMGTVCATLENKCRLRQPRPFFSPCYCPDRYGRRIPGEVQQY